MRRNSPDSSSFHDHNKYACLPHPLPPDPYATRHARRSPSVNMQQRHHILSGHHSYVLNLTAPAQIPRRVGCFTGLETFKNEMPQEMPFFFCELHNPYYADVTILHPDDVDLPMDETSWTNFQPFPLAPPLRCPRPRAVRLGRTPEPPQQKSCMRLVTIFLKSCIALPPLNCMSTACLWLYAPTCQDRCVRSRLKKIVIKQFP